MIRAREMSQRVTRFIEDTPGDPDLTPQAIADRHTITPRSLFSRRIPGGRPAMWGCTQC